MTDHAHDRPSILVAVDPPGSAPESAAIDTLALATGWPLDLVHAAAPDTEPAEVEAIGRVLAEHAEAFSERGIEAEGHVLVGPPVDVVITAAETLGAAMIVVVGHRHDVGRRTVLGSFASALLKVADRPVLVLPAGPAHSQPGFVAAVDRLIELIDRDVGADGLSELREAAEAQLEAPSSEAARRHLGQRLVDALHRFETDHPNLTAAINDVSYYLSGMGI